jgi:hypothetical protein
MVILNSGEIIFHLTIKNSKIVLFEFYFLKLILPAEKMPLLITKEKTWDAINYTT